MEAGAWLEMKERQDSRAGVPISGSETKPEMGTLLSQTARPGPERQRARPRPRSRT